MAVLCHFNNLKVSHADSFGITKSSGYLSIIYGGPTFQRRKVQKYLVMNINYRNQGMVKFSMIINLYSVLQDFPEHLGETAANPDDEHILKGSDKIKTQDLLGDQAQTFHHTLSQLIFMSARTQK